MLVRGVGGAHDALTTCSTEFLHYRKNKIGAEVQYRIARANKITVGLDYLDTKRERTDFDRSKETKAYFEWKTGSWDAADLRVKYQHLTRRSDCQAVPT